MKRPLLGIAIAFSLGILGEELLDIPIFYCFLFALIFLFLSLLFIRSKKAFLLFIALGFLFIGSSAYKYSASLPKNHLRYIVSVERDFPCHVLLQGKILNRPTERLTWFNQQKSEFLLGIKSVKVDNKWQPSCGTLLVQIFNPRVNFTYGSEVILEGDLFLPRPATNPGQFDYKKFLERRKIFYILKVKENDFSKIAARGQINLIKLFAYKISENIEKLIDRFTPSEEGSILKAILLGKRQDIDQEMNEDFIKTGTVHILAISGLHVGLLVYIFILLFKLLRLPFKVWSLILAPLVIFYCVMVDNRPPVTRAAIMTLVFLFGRILKREQDLLNTLALSALVILFLNPNDIFDVGFQLSFLTVGSIIYFTPRLEEMTLIMPLERKILHPSGIKKAKGHLLRALLVSFSAWMGSALFIARYFNIFSPITVIANLFVVPWMFFVLASSVTFILFGFVSSLFGLIFSEVSSFAILILLKMASIFSKVPFAYFRAKSPSWVFIIGFYAFLFLFFNRKHFKVNPVRHWRANVDVNGVSNGVKAKYFLITALLFFNVLIWHNAFFAARDFLKISFLDVGKGDSIFLEFPKGGTMLIDGGEGLGTDMGRLVVSRFLGAKGINKIDVVAATHPHTDHIGGLVSILKNFKVRFFIDNGDGEANALYAESQRLLRQKGIKTFAVKEGDLIKGFCETELLVLNPPVQKFNELNNNSLVIKLQYKDFSILFCADIEKEAARNLLLTQNENLPSIVLKVPHHGGSLGDIAGEFFEKINPKIAVISLGNRDVNSDILSALNKLHAKIYRTDKNGAVFLTKTKDRYSESTFKK